MYVDTPVCMSKFHPRSSTASLEYRDIYTCSAVCLQDGLGKEACMCSGSKLWTHWAGILGRGVQTPSGSLGSFHFSFPGQRTARVRIRAGTPLAQVLSVHTHPWYTIYTVELAFPFHIMSTLPLIAYSVKAV